MKNEPGQPGQNPLAAILARFAPLAEATPGSLSATVVERVPISAPADVEEPKPPAVLSAGAEALLADLTRLAAALACEPWATPAHRAILERWQTVAKAAGEAGRDVGEFHEDLQAWGQRWREMSQAKPTSVSPTP